jgi:hypothetical protein
MDTLLIFCLVVVVLYGMLKDICSGLGTLTLSAFEPALDLAALFSALHAWPPHL